MVHISSCCYLFSPSWLSTGWTFQKSLADFPKDFWLPAPASKLQRASTERASVRHWLRDAEQSFVVTSVQRAILTDQIHSIILDPAFCQIFPVQRHGSVGSAKGPERPPRRVERARKRLHWSRSTDDHKSPKARHRARQGSTEDPFAEAETSKQLDDHWCCKGHSAKDRPRCFKILYRPIPQRPQQELEELRLDEGGTPKEAAVEPGPERQEELRVDPSAKKDKRLKSENTK